MPRGGPQTSACTKWSVWWSSRKHGRHAEQLHPSDPSYHAMPNSAEDVYATTFGVRNWNLGS
jgi:hypothetical protein